MKIKKINMSIIQSLFLLDKESQSFYQSPKLFDIFLYPTIIVICKYIKSLKAILFNYFNSNFHNIQTFQFIKRKEASKNK